MEPGDSPPTQPPPPPPAATRAPSLSDPLTSPNPSHPLTLPDLAHEFVTLAAHGSYRTLLDKLTRSLSLSHSPLPHSHLLYLAFNSLALAKLRRYPDALRDLDDLDSPSYRFESYPDTYPGMAGSFVPFGLRLMRCLLPAKLGKKGETIDRLYELLGFVRERIEDGGDGSGWRRREEFVIGSIVRHHLAQKEYLLCVNLIRDVIVRDRENAGLWSRLGYVQMQFGDVEGARASFDEVERIISNKKGEEGVRVLNLASRNKALMYMVEKDYVSALREYERCIERDGSDLVAINNKALCLMYLRDLSGSIKVLESALERVPTVALNETLVVNLCSMYELAHVNHTEIKRTLSNWIAQVAPDDFDTSCTRV
ncbi:hypothetical protein Drorol1_Dr00028001 [Drosera rotundifolia]